MVTTQNVLQRLAGFADLEEDWDGYGAVTISSVSIERASSLIEKWPTNLPYPMVSPLTEGGIILEWEVGQYGEPGNRVVILDIDAEGMWDADSGYVWDHDAGISLESDIESIQEELIRVWIKLGNLESLPAPELAKLRQELFGLLALMR